jgi:hypothetical protein
MDVCTIHDFDNLFKSGSLCYSGMTFVMPSFDLAVGSGEFRNRGKDRRENHLKKHPWRLFDGSGLVIYNIAEWGAHF